MTLYAVSHEGACLCVLVEAFDIYSAARTYTRLQPDKVQLEEIGKGAVVDISPLVVEYARGVMPAHRVGYGPSVNMVWNDANRNFEEVTE